MGHIPLSPDSRHAFGILCVLLRRKILALEFAFIGGCVSFDPDSDPDADSYTDEVAGEEAGEDGNEDGVKCE